MHIFISSIAWTQFQFEARLMGTFGPALTTLKFSFRVDTVYRIRVTVGFW